MKHPLTEQQCELLSRQPWLDPDVDVESTIHDMRTAADWQLEQVIDWIKECPNYDLETHAGLGRMIQDLKAAMRPPSLVIFDETGPWAEYEREVLQKFMNEENDS